jgi:pyruvate formate-lyase/glycerol dehydratase family glycyl radical enzyme
MKHQITSRVQKLRDKMVVQPAICTERAYYMTQSYQQTEGEPYVLRRAKALRRILSHMTVRIEDGELIVGSQTSKTRGGSLLPEIYADWILDDMDHLDTRKHDPYQALSEEEKETIKALLPYWKGRSLHDQIIRTVPQELQKYDHVAVSSMGFSENGHNPCHVAIDYRLLLSEGLQGMEQKALAEKEKLDPGKYEDVQKGFFLDAVLIAYEGVETFAKRYADLAGQMAEKEQDEKRKNELLEIVKTCRKVPYYPAETFREALQSCWFVYVCLMIEGWGAGMSMGRADQYLYPFYKKDKDEGRITDEEAVELLSLVLIKMNGVMNPQSDIVSSMMSGSPTMQGMTIGGVTREGKDAVNPLSFLILDAEEDVGLANEDLVIRVNRKNLPEFLERACEVARNLNGKLKFVSDETTIKALMSTGISRDDANGYISTGCHNPTIPAVTHDIGGSSFNYPLILDLVFGRGKSPVTGEKLGIDVGDPRTFSTFEELEDAFEKEFEYVFDRLLYFVHVDMKLYEQMPCPLLSSFYEGCMEKGLDMNENGVRLTTHSSAFVGAPNVGDALAAIKRTVYEDHSLTMDRVLALCENNLEGDGEALKLLKEVPKFGNNDPYVDDITRDVLARSCDYINSHSSYKGTKVTSAALAMTINIPFGQVVGAQPDGRKTGDPLSEGGISPYQGRNTAGFTSTLASVAHLDQVKLCHGSILNVRMSKGAVSSRQNLAKFAQAVSAFCDMGGNLVQFNFVDTKTLLDAQEHPENYKDLLVRVATYSAYFVELSKDLQDDIIRRYEFQEL